ncbi:carbohydrate porin [Maribellus sediminis]|uniref:carbohydrate porin n=1 Tax=Maribellus sediminis TaxID=2696285 RepID=UPI0014307436|nr:carbohydrate porin [Maribellus sediminis]
MRKQKILVLSFAFLLSTVLVYGQEQKQRETNDIAGPSSVGNQMKSDIISRKAKVGWYFLDSLDAAKDRFYDKTGFKANLDYNSQIMGVTKAIGNNIGASGVLRLYGKWDFVRRGTPFQGGLVFNLEHRHKYTENPLREYGILDVGYAGLIQSVYNDDKFRVTNLYWRQTFGTNKVVVYAGFVDMTDWTDIHAAASPWSSFNNMVFATGSVTIGGGYPGGSLGLMVSAWLTKQLYVVGSFTDINGKATEFWKGFDTFFNKFETVKTLELGYTPGLEYVFFKNAHLTFWQVDKQTGTGIPSGWGIAGSVSWGIGEKHLPFIRGGYANEGGAFYKGSVSVGYSYNIAGPNTFGIGFNWNRPNPGIFGDGLKDQHSSEIFFKWQVTHHSELTPNIQLIGNPAFNSKDNFTTLFGLRARVFI